MFAGRGGDGDGTKMGGLPGIHLSNIAKADFARGLRNAAFDGHWHLLVRVCLKGLHIIVVVVTMAYDHPSQMRQILQSDAIWFTVIVAKFLRKPGVGQNAIASKVDEDAGMCDAGDGQGCHVCFLLIACLSKQYRSKFFILCLMVNDESSEQEADRLHSDPRRCP